MDQFVYGSTTGTGANIDIDLGFTPDFVKVWNPNDAGSLWPVLEWFAGLPNAAGFKYLKSVDSGATGNASSNKITVGGITPLGAAATDTKRGFRIGTDADINANTEVIYYVAFRGAEPKRV